MAAHHAHTPPDIETPDAWHTHVHEAPAQPEHGQLAGWKVFWVGMAGYILTVAVVVVLVVYYYAVANQTKLSREEFPERYQGVAVQSQALTVREQTLDGDFRKGMGMDEAMNRVAGVKK